MPSSLLLPVGAARPRESSGARWSTNHLTGLAARRLSDVLAPRSCSSSPTRLSLSPRWSPAQSSLCSWKHAHELRPHSRDNHSLRYSELRLVNLDHFGQDLHVPPKVTKVQEESPIVRSSKVVPDYQILWHWTVYMDFRSGREGDQTRLQNMLFRRSLTACHS